MYRYILKRLLFLIPTVLGVTLIIFAVMNITPGNPGRMILGANANAAEVEAVNQELGFYDPASFVGPVIWKMFLPRVTLVSLIQQNSMFLMSFGLVLRLRCVLLSWSLCYQSA